MLDEDRALAVSGGEGRFMLRGDEARASEFAWALGEDGFREGWCERAAQFRGLVSFGEGGVPFDGDTGLPLESADLAALPPAVQLECRARAELGDVEVLAISAGKRAGTHVSLDVQLENHRELCELQAKFDFTAAYTTDAGTGVSKCEDTVLRDGMGNPIPCVSQAAGRHDGVVCSGTIEATRGLDNYVGEMAALLLAITDAAEGGRVLVVLDASSPVRAWLRFRGRHNRHKLDYYAARLLDSLDQALQKLEVVVFFWQTSHVGSPTNEWADLLATAALLMKVAPFVLSPMSFASMRYSRPPKSLFRWALERGRRVVFGRLTEGISHTVFFEEGDVRLGGFVKEAEEISAAVRQGTLLLADRLGRMSTAAADMVRGAGCVCGAVREGRPVLPTWSHVCFWCVAPEYRRPREEILRAVGGVELGDVFSGAAMAGTHRQLSGAVQYLQGPAANHDFNLRDEQGREAEGEMRRLFGACILGAGDRWIDRSALVRQALRRLVLAGAELLQIAGVQEAQLAKDVVELNCRAYLMRWVFKPWRDLVRRSGPGRVAALADIRLSRRTVALAITRSTREGEFSRLWGWIAWRRLVREVRAARSEVEASREDDCRAPALWRIAAAVRVRRWRAVAVAERRQRQGGWVRLQAVRSLDHSATLSRFVWAALRSHELPDLVDDRVATRVGEWGLEVGRRELALRALRRCVFFRLGSWG